MEYIFILSNGIGNKIFMLINILHKYPKTNFYIVDKQSHHKEEKLIVLFPALKNIKNIKFIDWREYDKLKDDVKEIKIDHNHAYYTIEGFTPSIKKYFKIDEKYDSLKDKYDFTKGIFVHFRLGDKFTINLQELKKSKPPKYVVMKPEYYLDNISALLEKKNGPVYIFSDEPDLAKCLLSNEFEYPREDVNETFYCFRNAKRVIISESTLSIAAVLLGSKKKDFVFPNFLYLPPSYKLVKSPYFDGGESNEKYIMKTLEDYKEVIKKCKS
jgi:hypothetical protein